MRNRLQNQDHDQLRLERNYGEAVRLLQARLAQFHFDSQFDKAYDQAWLAFMQRLLAIRLAQRLPLNRRAIHLSSSTEINWTTSGAVSTGNLSQAYAVLGEKDSALKAAERAIMVLPRAKDAVVGPSFEENLALIQTIFGENSRAISALAQLLQTPYFSLVYYPTPITPALLRLDPIWDPLRADPAFQKLCQEKQP